MRTAENTIICDTCGDMLYQEQVIDHAIRTGHRKFEYKGELAI